MLESADGAPPCNRCDERRAYNAVQPHFPGLGRRAAGAAGNPQGMPPGGCGFFRDDRDAGSRHSGTADSRDGHGRGPACKPVRAGLLAGGGYQEHLWNGMLYADEHRGPAGAKRERTADNDGLANRRKTDLCAGGQRVHGRSHDPVAAG